ncbi:DUF732 domain-containing protein [Mycobacterium shigaense]|uniref:Uncharacterized protein n=1 Tax=Mycobacterium shigaense TaxID=722731 RepID=A0A1Z4ELN3_9MYCO|nr:DUF732 domain-containing protein [Mycobacterium shigaense]PRI14574.1 hypothetical protein B2J96_14650 [Mycobacterium shigaense]BAX93822.1 hypothetical protein MSG_03696 [Mycobacterium shigaense]
MSVRGLRLMCIPVVVAAALTVGSGVAVADDDSYIAQLTKLGFSGDRDSLIALGHAICSDRSTGYTPDQLAQVVQTKFTNATYADATSVISAAESAYWP